MHPDVGAIIGIALAGSVLLVALLFLCIFHMPWPCCENFLKSQSRSMTRSHRIGRILRPSTTSTSSQVPFSNNRLSVVEMHNQTPAHICNSTGIVNPMWQMHCTCHSAILTASQQSLNFAHCHPMAPCQFHHAPQHHATTISEHNNNNGTELSSFQYLSPQLLSPSDSPPPYESAWNRDCNATCTSTSSNTTAQNNLSSPKH